MYNVVRQRGMKGFHQLLMVIVAVLLLGYVAHKSTVVGDHGLSREDRTIPVGEKPRNSKVDGNHYEIDSRMSGDGKLSAPTIRQKKSTENKDDLAFLQSFSKLLNDIGMCNQSHSIAVGGLNRGQGASVLLNSCPNIRLYGFEISPTELEVARQNLAKYPNVVYNRMGMGDVNDIVRFTDSGSLGGIYGADNSKSTVQVVPLAEYFAKLSVDLVYLLIDVEGYESIVIAGMGLQHERNRKRFPMFQYELGGTWAERDKRHPKGSMNQLEIASFLMNRGYKLFMMGNSALYPITSAEFFRDGDRNEGKGSFVQGNALAMHPEFAHPQVQEWVQSMIQ